MPFHSYIAISSLSCYMGISTDCLDQDSMRLCIQSCANAREVNRGGGPDAHLETVTARTISDSFLSVLELGQEAERSGD